MPTIVDDRVVSLEFQNSNFERNVKESLGTIDRLKKALDFSNAGKGLETIENTANKVDFNVMQKGLIQVQSHFSLMDQIAMNALNNIENKIINTSERMIKSLSTDQINAGWDKYAQKTQAVQTIMAATASSFTDTGEHMDYVNGQLEKLNWFTDETSYNFLDMVNNIGKFTSNQIPLEDSVTAMEGISTWAAISGANIGEAGRAMYNLSQAISVGAVKLMDWKSIENANMATAEFKQTAIDTAVAMGTLADVGGGYFETLAGHEVSVRNFNEALKDEWFTSEVLIETLNQYGGFTDVLNDFMNSVYNTNMTTSDAIGIINDYINDCLDMSDAMDTTGMSADELSQWLDVLGDSQYELGRKSFAAAQEAKTFQEAIDSVKDAVSTGWMNTFELIFGDYEEAKVLWTDLANSLYDVFAEGGNARNELLTDALTSNWTILNKEIHAAGVSTDEFHEALSKTYSKYNKGTLDEMAKQFGGIDGAIKAGAISTRTMKEALQSLVGSSSGLENIRENLGMGAVGDDVKEVQQRLADLGYEFSQFGVDGIIGKETTDIIKMFQEANGLEVTGIVDQATIDALKETNGLTNELIDSWGDLMDNVSAKGGRELLIGGLANIGNTLIEIINKVKGAWEMIFPPMTADRLYEIIYIFNYFTETILDTVRNSNALETILGGILSIFRLAQTVVMAVAGGIYNIVSGILSMLSFIPGVLAMFAGLITDVATFASDMDLVGLVIGTVTGVFRDFGAIIGETIKEIGAYIRNNENLVRISKAIQGIFNKIGTALRFIRFNLGGGTGIAEFFKSLGQSLKDLTKIGIDAFFRKIADFFESIARIDFLEGAQKFVKWFENLEYNLKRFAFRLTTRIKAFRWEYFKEDLISFKDGIVNFFANLTIPGAESFEKKLESIWFRLKTRFAAFKWNAFQKDGANITDGLAALFGNFKMPDFSGILNYVTSVFAKASEYIKSIDFNAVKDSIVAKIKELKEPVLNALKAVGDFFLIGFTGLGTIFAGLFQKMFDKIHDFKMPDFSNVVYFLKRMKFRLTTKIKAAFSSFLQNNDETITFIKDFFANSFAKAGEGLQIGFDKIKSIFDGIKSGVGASIKAGSDILIGMINAVMDFLGRLPIKSMVSLIAALSFLKSISTITKAFASAGGMFDAIKGFFNNVTGAIHKQSDIGDIVLKIANALVRVMAALFIMATFGDMDKIKEAMKQLEILAGIMIGIPVIFGLLTRFKLISADDIDKLARTVAMMSGALWIMVQSLKSLNKVTIKQETPGMLMEMAAILVAMMAVVAVMKKGGLSVNATDALGMVAIAGSMWILIQVMKSLNDFKINPNLNDNMGMFAIMIAGLVTIAGMAAKVPAANMAGVLALAFSMEILVDVMKRLDQYEVQDPEALTGKFIGIIAALVAINFAVAKSTSLAGGGSAKDIGIGVLAMSAALYLIIMAIEEINKLSTSELKKGALVITGIALIFTLWMLAMSAVSKLDNDPQKTGVGILAMSAGILILSIAMHALGRLTPSQLAKSLVAIGIIGLIFAGLILVSKKAGGSAKTFIALAVAVGVLAASLAVLAYMPEDGLIRAAECLGGVMIALAAIIGLSSFGSVGTKVASILEIIAVMGSIVAAIYALNEMGALQSFMLMEALTDTLWGLCGTLAVVDAVGMVGGIGAVAQGIIGLDLVIADILAVFWGIGAVIDKYASGDNTGFLDSMEKGIEVIEKVGEGIGRFVGKIKGGYDLAISEDSITVADNLTAFSEHLKPFIELTSGEDFTNAAAGVTSFGSFIEILANAEISGFLDGNGAALDGIEKITWGEKLKELAEALAGFASVINENSVNFDDVTAAANALDLLATMNEKIPKSGGKIQEWFGERDMGNFGENLAVLGDGVSKFAASVTGITADSVEPAASAIQILAKMNDDIPKVGGLLETITGRTGYTKFSLGLKQIGKGLANYAGSVKGIGITDVISSSMALGILIDLANEMPTVGGLFSGIFGEEMSLSQFGTDLSTFGESLNTYNTWVKDIDAVKITAVTKAMSGLAKAMKDDFTGASFSAGEFIVGLEYLQDDVIKSFMSLWGDLTGQKGEGLNEIGQAIALGIANGIADVQEIDINPILDNLLFSLDTAIAGKENEIKSQAGKFVGAFCEGMRACRAKVQQFARMLNLVAVNALGTLNGYSKGYYIGSNFANGVRAAYNLAYQAGQYLVEGVDKGIDNKKDASLEHAKQYAKDVLKATKDGLEEKSPSKATTLFGENLDKGLDIGILNGTENSLRVASNYASAVLGRMSDTFSGEVDVTPGITPKFDLTAIQNGQRMISGFVDGTTMQANIVANAMSTNNANKLDTLISNTARICQVLLNGSDVYLDENVLVGRMNRRLGALMA